MIGLHTFWIFLIHCSQIIIQLISIKLAVSVASSPSLPNIIGLCNAFFNPIFSLGVQTFPSSLVLYCSFISACLLIKSCTALVSYSSIFLFYIKCRSSTLILFISHHHCYIFYILSHYFFHHPLSLLILLSSLV